MKIAIIGAGLSGSVLYNLLKKDGDDVTIFEKSRGAGGRCSTRYINEKLIDHGTPYFQAHDKDFVEFCDEKVAQNILVQKGEKRNCYYPTNGMNKLCSSLIDENDFIKNTQIVACDFQNNFWSLKDQNGVRYEKFEKLFITIPAPQILELDIALPKVIKEKLQSVTYDSIATLMVYSYTLQNLLHPALIKSDIFKKIVDNSSKYNYNNFSSYVIHLAETITNKQNFSNKQEVQKFIEEKIYDISAIDLQDDFHLVPHFWKYAFVSEAIDEEFIYEKSLSLGFCGDYFRNNNLEGSYQSAIKLKDLSE